MKKIAFRLGLVVVAALVAAAMVYGLTSVGKQGKGPIEQAMDYTGEVVTSVEQKIMTEPRAERREDKLQWFRAYKADRKLLLAPERILLGAFDNETNDSYQGIVDLEDTLHTHFPLVHIYCAWGSKPNEKFPAKQVNNIAAMGSVPVITWEPWLNDFNDELFATGKKGDERNRNGLRDIANGKYDQYIKEWAIAAGNANTPLFLRLGHEMNDGYRYPWGPQNNDSADFIAAWHHVHDVFKKQGTRNVIWVWSPHPAYSFREFYPGSEYVDYIGVGVLNYGTVAAWSKWWSFDNIFGSHYQDLAAYNKPIMITEFGSLAIGGDRAAWYRSALQSLPAQYPRVRSVLFFNFTRDNTTTEQTLNWGIRNDKLTTKTIAAVLAGWK